MNQVREQLHKLIEGEEIDLTDNRIICLSQLLDKLICQYHDLE
ncbi:Spo0E family sporulation regulatory protein-aspartic acid phosphatase [Tepidimicrobium xylanilyticum]